MRKTVKAVCCALAALLLVCSLLTQIRLNAVRDELRALHSERETLCEELRAAEVRLALRLPLGEIERLAEERLGMRRCRPDQRVLLPAEEEYDGAEPNTMG